MSFKFIPYLKDLIGNTGEDKVIQAMQAYAKQKCKEQREICAEKADYVYDADMASEGTLETEIDTDSILNAPEPKFD